MMHFLFKTLKLLTFEFQFWKFLREGKCPLLGPPTATALLLQTLVQTVMQIFYVLFMSFWSFDKKERFLSLISCNKRKL